MVPNTEAFNMELANSLPIRAQISVVTYKLISKNIVIMAPIRFMIRPPRYNSVK